MSPQDASITAPASTGPDLRCGILSVVDGGAGDKRHPRPSGRGGGMTAPVVPSAYGCSDESEACVYRFAGTGGEGRASIAKAQASLIRPWLSCRKGDILLFGTTHRSTRTEVVDQKAECPLISTVQASPGGPAARVRDAGLCVTDDPCSAPGLPPSPRRYP